MKTFFFVVGCLVCVLVSATAGWTHGVRGHVDRSEGYLVTAEYDDGEPMSYAAVEIKGPVSEIMFQSGRTDRNGHVMFRPDRQGRWKIEIKDGMGHRLALNLDVSGDAAADPETSAIQSETPSHGLTRTEKAVIGISIIFGASGMWYGWKARRSMSRTPKK